MRTLQSILLATDFRPASLAAARAVVRLTSVFGSKVTLLHVLEPMPGWPVALHLLQEQAMGPLGKLSESLTAQGAIVEEAVVVTAPPADAIVEKAREIDADLIVMGVGDAAPFQVVVGPKVEAVLQSATQPVLAVRPGDPEAEFRVILCPVDQSRTSRRGLRNAIQLAKAFGGRLIVLSVVPETSWITAALESGTLTDAWEEYEKNWRAEFERTLQTMDFGDVVWQTDVRKGEPHTEIAAAAKDHGADLIVMGSTGRTGLAHVVMGSVTRRVLRHLPCSILTVKDENLLDELYDEDLRTIKRHLAEGRALLNKKSGQEALSKFRHVLTRHPFHVAALEGLAEAHELLGQTDEAARCRDRAEAIRNPN